ncbi:pectinesterase [Hordeum vulgare]|nr:pectinesterase [Hordeum vulgare]
MAALSSPLLISILVVLVATATTTQCRPQKHHRHAAKPPLHRWPPSTPSAAPPRTRRPASRLPPCTSTPPRPSPGDVHHRPPPPREHPIGRARLPPRRALGRLLLSPALSSTLSAPSSSKTPLRRGAAQDCLELHDATLSSLSRSASLLASPGEGLPSVRAHLSAALTNKATCLDGLAGASGPRMDGLLASLDDAYEHVSNSLSLVARGGGASFQATVARIIHHNRRLLQDDEDSDGDDDDDSRNENDDDGNSRNGNDDNGNSDGNNDSGETVITVAKDGSGNFRTVGEAVAAAPNNSEARTVIQVKAGTYVENVEVPPYKTNIALVGEGRDVTVITGSRSAATAGPPSAPPPSGCPARGSWRGHGVPEHGGRGEGQAVALRVNAGHGGGVPLRRRRPPGRALRALLPAVLTRVHPVRHGGPRLRQRRRGAPGVRARRRGAGPGPVQRAHGAVQGRPQPGHRLRRAQLHRGGLAGAALRRRQHPHPNLPRPAVGRVRAGRGHRVLPGPARGPRRVDGLARRGAGPRRHGLLRGVRERGARRRHGRARGLGRVPRDGLRRGRPVRRRQVHLRRRLARRHLLPLRPRHLNYAGSAEFRG